jgi:hypothetical protein
MKRHVLIALACAFVLPIVAHAQAQEREHAEQERMRAEQERKHADQNFERFLFPPELVMQHQRQLGLTEVQRQEITQAIAQLQAEVVELQWQLQDRTVLLGEILNQPRIDTQDALQRVEELFEIERQVKTAHLVLLIDIKNTLSEEQQRRLMELRAQRWDR